MIVKQVFPAWWLSRYTGTFNLAMNSGTSGGRQFEGTGKLKLADKILFYGLIISPLIQEIRLQSDILSKLP